MLRVLCVLAALSSAPLAWGTSCGYLPVCARVDRDSVLFTGLVTDAGIPVPDGTAHNVRMKVQEIFAGLKAGTSEVTIEVNGGWIEKNEIYLVDARRAPDGRLELPMCGNTNKVGGSTEFLEYLRARKQGKGKTSLTVYVDAKRMPVPDFELRISGPKGQLTGTTNSEGDAVFDDLAPGKYFLAGSRPGYEIDTEEHQDKQIEVLPFTCAGARLAFRAVNEVSGIVRDVKGLPVSSLPLNLIMPGKEHEMGAPFRAETDAGGRFRFTGVNPGRYHLGTNILQYPSGPLPRTYYPGRRTEAESVQIDVRAGETIGGLQFTLPDYGSRRNVRIRVIDESGNPVEGAMITDEREDSDAKPDIAGLECPKTGADGVTVAQGYEGSRYLIGAFTPPVPGRGHRTSEPVEIAPGKGDLDIVMVLRPIPAASNREK